MANDYPLPLEMLNKWASESPNKIYLRQPINRQYKEYNWKQTQDAVFRVVTALRALGLQEGDRVSIMSKNCAEYYIVDFAISVAGMVSAPIYFTAGVKTAGFILDHSEAKAVFVGKLDSTAAIDEVMAARPDVISIALPYPTAKCTHQWDDIIANHEPATEFPKKGMDDLFSLSYTSGSTGNPKGVELTYRNIGYGAMIPAKQTEVTSDSVLFSYLPLAHITERALVEYLSLYTGAQVGFVESLDTFAEDLANTAPSFFISVPRLWMKFQSGILANLPQSKLDVLLKIPFISGLIKKKIKQKLGLSQARLVGSGSAPISEVVLRWYESIGVNVSEGWGMTETTGLAITNYPFRSEKVGTIGAGIPGTDVKISDIGEIMVRSDGVARGYYKEPEKTAETFVDGWLHTGDKGELDKDGYVKITGRVKDIFKSGKGKYVIPLPIESLLFENQLIEQCCVMGSGLPQPVAVVNVSAETSAGMSNEQISASLAETLASVNARLEAHMKLDNIVVAKDVWDVHNGLLTATLKIKRSDLEQKYGDLIAKGSSDKVIWEAA